MCFGRNQQAEPHLEKCFVLGYQLRKFVEPVLREKNFSFANVLFYNRGRSRRAQLQGGWPFLVIESMCAAPRTSKSFARSLEASHRREYTARAYFSQGRGLEDQRWRFSHQRSRHSDSQWWLRCGFSYSFRKKRKVPPHVRRVRRCLDVPYEEQNEVRRELRPASRTPTRDQYKKEAGLFELLFCSDLARLRRGRSILHWPRE